MFSDLARAFRARLCDGGEPLRERYRSRAEMHLSATQIGVLLSAFSLAYGFAQLPVGPLLDRFGGWPLIGGGRGLWSVSQLFTGLITGMGGFVPARILLGFGEAPFFPGAVKLSAKSSLRRSEGGPWAR